MTPNHFSELHTCTEGVKSFVSVCFPLPGTSLISSHHCSYSAGRRPPRSSWDSASSLLRFPVLNQEHMKAPVIYSNLMHARSQTELYVRAAAWCIGGGTSRSISTPLALAQCHLSWLGIWRLESDTPNFFVERGPPSAQTAAKGEDSIIWLDWTGWFIDHLSSWGFCLFLPRRCDESFSPVHRSLLPLLI